MRMELEVLNIGKRAVEIKASSVALSLKLRHVDVSYVLIKLN